MTSHEDRDRKAEHIQLALQEEMQLERNFFEDYFFEQRALPEIDFDEIDTSAEFLGRKLTSPLLISCTRRKNVGAHCAKP